MTAAPSVSPGLGFLSAAGPPAAWPWARDPGWRLRAALIHLLRAGPQSLIPAWGPDLWSTGWFTGTFYGPHWVPQPQEAPRSPEPGLMPMRLCPQAPPGLDLGGVVLESLQRARLQGAPSPHRLHQDGTDGLARNRGTLVAMETSPEPCLGTAPGA